MMPALQASRRASRAEIRTPVSRPAAPIPEISVELADVTAPSRYRLCQATVTEAFVLCPREPRQACLLHDIAADHRTPVAPWRHAG